MINLSIKPAVKCLNLKATTASAGKALFPMTASNSHHLYVQLQHICNAESFLSHQLELHTSACTVCSKHSKTRILLVFSQGSQATLT